MHPVLYLVVEFILTVVVIGFTPAYSIFRLAGLLSVTFCVFQSIPLCMPYMTRTPWAALVGGYSVTYLYHYLDLALLSRWSFEHGAPVDGLVKASHKKGAESILGPLDKSPICRRLLFGLNVTSSFRFVGTPYQVRNVPMVLAIQRKEFLQRTFAIIAISYIVLDFINFNNNPEIASKFLTLEKVPLLSRLHQVTGEELTIRFFTVLAAGIGLHCVQGGIYHICALLAVSSGLSEPLEWPPFYGSAHEAYTLRNFWGIFWHQTNKIDKHYSSHITRIRLALRCPELIIVKGIGQNCRIEDP